MYSFLAFFGHPADQPTPDLKRLGSLVRTLTPANGVELETTLTALPEITGGWAFVTPDPRPPTPTLSEHVDADVAALVLGTVIAPEPPAAAVASAFRRGGIAAVRALDGCFAGLVVDRPEKCAWILSDELGLRALRYVEGASGLFVSPHDALLVAATPDRELDFDLISSGSILGLDWSLLGQPLLERVKQCRPFVSVSFQSGRIAEHHHAPFGSGPRIDPSDRAGIDAAVQRVADALEKNTRSFVHRVREAARPLETALTAGMDSRALLALLLSVADPSELTAFTWGAPQSLDVRIARTLCRWTGVAHQSAPPDEPSSVDFTHNTDVRAFFCNGETNAKRALHRREPFDPVKISPASGGGGEVFRGFFYPYFGAFGHVPSGVGVIRDRLIAWRFRRLGRLPFIAGEIEKGIQARLDRSLHTMAQGATDGHDVVDLFYVYERYGRWGGAHARLPNAPTWTPYDSVSAIREAYRLPSPVGRNCPVQALLIRRKLPLSARLMPVNGGQLLAFEGPGDLRFLFRQAANLQAKAVERLRARVRPAEQTHDQRRAELFAGPLRELVRDSLTERSSLSVQLLGDRGIRSLLDEHEKRSNQLEVLGSLMTLERWRLQVTRALSMGRSPFANDGRDG